MAELVGQREQQQRQRLLVVRLDRQHVEADALGLDRLVEQPVALGLLQRRGDRPRGESGFSSNIAASFAARPRKTRNSLLQRIVELDRPRAPSAG